jgi:hypothetical protein
MTYLGVLELYNIRRLQCRVVKVTASMLLETVSLKFWPFR